MLWTRIAARRVFTGTLLILISGALASYFWSWRLLNVYSAFGAFFFVVISVDWVMRQNPNNLDENKFKRIKTIVAIVPIVVVLMMILVVCHPPLADGSWLADGLGSPKTVQSWAEYGAILGIPIGIPFGYVVHWARESSVASPGFSVGGSSAIRTVFYDVYSFLRSLFGLLASALVGIVIIVCKVSWDALKLYLSKDYPWQTLVLIGLFLGIVSLGVLFVLMFRKRRKTRNGSDVTDTQKKPRSGLEP